VSSELEKEADFPRGGASALSPLEVRRIRQEAEKDVLFGVRDNYIYYHALIIRIMLIIQVWLRLPLKQLDHEYRNSSDGFIGFQT
jgi:hypothetical protein